LGAGRQQTSGKQNEGDKDKTTHETEVEGVDDAQT
jgi:hypothetical protein